MGFETQHAARAAAPGMGRSNEPAGISRGAPLATSLKIMLRYVIQMEFRTLRRDRWAIGLLVLLGALVSMAVIQGARWQREHQGQLRRMQKQDDSRFESMLEQHLLMNQSGQSWRVRNDPRFTMELAQQGR